MAQTQKPMAILFMSPKKEEHNDTIHWLKIGDERHTEGRKFAHYRHSGDVSKRCVDGAKEQKITQISAVHAHLFAGSVSCRKEDG